VQQEIEEDLLLGVEVVVEAAGLDTGSVTDVANRGLFEASLGDDLCSRNQFLFPTRGSPRGLGRT